MAAAPALIVIGPVPPPVHGQAVCTAAILEEVARQGTPFLSINTSEGVGGKINRIKAHIAAFDAIKSNSAKTVYLSVNARWGMVLTVFLTSAAKRRGMQVILHHHFYGYIPKAHKMMRKLIAVAGPDALHVTNCTAMSKEMQATYPELKNLIGYSNIGVVSSDLKPSPSRPLEDDSALSLGHLSNLTESKGIGTVIDTFRKLAEIFPNLKLHIAGPCHDRFATEAIKSICDEMGERVIYHGPVYGEDKQRFFNKIDIFVYPTKVDTQGIVNLEALACGKPVVATAFCCIPDDIGINGGMAVPILGDFTKILENYINAYTSNRTLAATNARARFEVLLKEHHVEKAALFAALNGQPVKLNGLL